MMPTKQPPQGKRHTQTESERKNYFMQMEMTGKQELQQSYQTYRC